MALTPEFLETQRQKGRSDALIDKFYSQQGDKQYNQFRNKFTAKYGDTATGALLDFTAYGTTKPTERFTIPKPSFLQRLGSSIASVPERAKRSFGTEEIREGRQEVSKGFDLADLPGDIADIIGPAIPVATGIAAGAVGAISPLPLLTAPLGAAVGGLAGEEARQTIGRTLGVQPQTISHTEEQGADVKKVALREGLGELGGRLLMKAGGRLLKPFAKHFDSELAGIAQRRGVDLPASSVVDAPVVQLTEAVTGKGIFGGSLKIIVNEAQEKLANQADEIVKGFSGTDDLTVAGQGISEGLQKYRAVWQGLKNKIYKEAAKILPKEDRPLTEATESALAEIIPRKGMASALIGDTGDSLLIKLQTALQQRGLKRPSLEALMATSDELGELIGKTRDVQRTGSDAVLGKIKNAIDRDIANHLKQFAPDAYAAATRADEFFAEGINGLNSKFGQMVKSLSDEPSKIVDSAIRPKSPERASQVLELIISTEGGAGRVANVQASFARKLIDEATKFGTKALQGESLINVLNKYGDETLDAILGQDARTAFREIANIAQALGKGRAIAEGSQTAFSGKIIATILAITNGQLQLAAQIVGADMVLSKLFQSQIGRKWLTEGLTAPTILEKLGAAGAEAIGRGVASPASSAIVE